MRRCTPPTLTLISALLLSACGRQSGLDGMGGFVASSKACLAGEMAFSDTMEKFDDVSAMKADSAREFYASRVSKQNPLASVFGAVWIMSYEEVLREGSSVVTGVVEPFRESNPELAASGSRAAKNVARDRYGDFCLFLAGKLIASGKARRDLERLSRGEG